MKSTSVRFDEDTLKMIADLQEYLIWKQELLKKEFPNMPLPKITQSHAINFAISQVHELVVEDRI